MNHDVSKVPIVDIIPFLVDATATCKNVVSVGSGTGKYEKWLMDSSLLEQCKWILVDPDPQSFDKAKIAIKPHYSNVKELVAASPDLAGNCILLLLWPNAMASTYDYEAVALLQPLGIVVLWEGQKELDGKPIYGAAMGKKLFEMLTYQGTYKLQSQKLYASKGYDYDSFNRFLQGMQNMGFPITPAIAGQFYTASRLWPKISWYSRQAEAKVSKLTTVDDTLHLLDIPRCNRPLVD